MKIITISGKAECGKDTTAKEIKNQLENMGYSVLICHYADLLKYICKQFFDWNGKKDEEGRTLLQMVGTDTIRRKDADFWVKFIKQILQFFPEEWDFVIIPDTRFPNEINQIKDTFYLVSLKVSRPNYENHLTEEQRQHPSETALDDYTFDYTLVNPGNKEGLCAEVDHFIDCMFTNEAKKDLITKIKEKL